MGDAVRRSKAVGDLKALALSQLDHQSPSCAARSPSPFDGDDKLINLGRLPRGKCRGDASQIQLHTHQVPSSLQSLASTKYNHLSHHCHQLK